MPTRGEIAASFDAIATEFDASRARPWPETLAFADELPPNSRVLDLACGGGRNLAFLRERGHRVIGFDAAIRLLRIAAAKVGGSNLVRGDAVMLPFAANAFDAVHCVAALHHLPSEDERRRGTREIARVLRPGGVALLSVWALEQERFAGAPGADVIVPWRRSDGRDVPRFYHLYRSGELESVVLAADLAVVRTSRMGNNHIVLAAKR